MIREKRSQKLNMNEPRMGIGASRINAGVKIWNAKAKNGGRSGQTWANYMGSRSVAGRNPSCPLTIPRRTTKEYSVDFVCFHLRPRIDCWLLGWVYSCDRSDVKRTRNPQVSSLADFFLGCFDFDDSRHSSKRGQKENRAVMSTAIQHHAVLFEE
jgi:hypothetical protein